MNPRPHRKHAERERVVIIVERIRRDRSCGLRWTKPAPRWRVWFSLQYRTLVEAGEASRWIRDYRNWRGEPA